MFNESDVQTKVPKPQSVCKKPTTIEPPARVVTEDEAKKAFQSPNIFDRRKSQVTPTTVDSSVDSDGYTYPYVYHEDIVHFVEPSLRLNQGMYKGSVVNGGYYVAPTTSTPTVVHSQDAMSYLKYIRNLIDQYMVHAS